MIAVLRFRRKIPKAEITQVHRMDNAFALRWILRSPQAYFIHTQENGLTGKTSDSIWRFLGSAHRTFERYVVRRAKSVVVFNETYSEVIRTWNPDAVFSPTWFDPELVSVMNEIRDAFKVVWIGRLETPKDPALAVDAFAALVAIDGQGPWSLEILGSGTMLDSLREKVSTLGPEVSDRISVLGRVSPKEVATRMAKAGIFLMTSHPGYEGYPRVLVESLASGLPAVVTEGSDTGGLVIEGVNGFVRTRSADDLAKSLMSARTLDRDEVRRAVSSHDAPTLVARIFRMGNNLEKVTS
jgi:glycosyltransferase involved in cell wall biosynthesis